VKFLSLSFLLIFFQSCDVRDKDQVSKSINTLSLSTVEEVDSDYDGISDKLEIQKGDDPFIASLPHVYIWDVNSLNARLSFIDVTSGSVENTSSIYGKPFGKVVERKINHLIFNQLFNGSIDQDMFPTLEDYYKTNLGCISNKDYFKQKVKYDYLLENNDFRSFLFKMDYKVGFDDIKNIEAITRTKIKTVMAYPELNLESDDLELRIFDEVFKFNNVTSLQGLKKFEENRVYNETRSIDQFINSPHCAYAIVEDFDYEKYNKKYKFSEVLSNQSSNNSTLFLLFDGDVVKLSFTASKFNIIDILKKEGLKLELDSNNMILSINDKVNELPYLLDYTHLNRNNMPLRRWFYLNTENRAIYEKTLPGSVHIIAYSSLKDIVSSSTFNESLVEGLEFSNSLKLQGVSTGDELELEIDVLSRIPQLDNVHRLIDGIVKSNRRRGPRGGDEVVWVKGKKACSYYETNSNPSLSNYVDSQISTFNKELFSITIGDKTISPTYTGETKLYYKFIVDYDDVINEEVEINLPEKSIKSFSYQRNITYSHVHKKKKRCKDKTNSSQTLSSKRIFKYIINAKRKGVIK
jgi:hypothetical protein